MDFSLVKSGVFVNCVIKLIVDVTFIQRRVYACGYLKQER